MYPEHNQMDPRAPVTKESSAYPANPDSEYGWEKLFSERLYLAYGRNLGLRSEDRADITTFSGRWGLGRGDARRPRPPICRKVAEAHAGGEIEIWGDGEQTRSFLYIDECIEGTLRLTRSSFVGPVNIGSEEMVTINQLASMAMDIAGKHVRVRHIPGPLGVRGRNSDNELIRQSLGWEPSQPLRAGLEKTYAWIDMQVQHARSRTSVAA